MKILKYYLCIFLLLSCGICFAQQKGLLTPPQDPTPTPEHEYSSTKFKGLSKFQRINSAEGEISLLRQEINSLKNEVNMLKREIETLKSKKDSTPTKKEEE